MSKQKQKESVSLRIAKTALAIAIITGLGTIIFGGGVVIMKYYNSEVNNKIIKTVDQEAKNYYDTLEEKCGDIYDFCCLSSLDIMRQGNYKEADENGNCPDGFEMNMQKCETTFQWCEPVEKLNIIGNYVDSVTSMCSQNCDRFYIGSYEIVNRLQNVDGVNRKEIVFATGDMIEIEELPTIAGPDSRGQINPNKVEAIKFKIDNYQKIDFPKISISEEELANYLENKDAKFTLKFENPLDRELRFKFSMNADHNFQYAVLKPKETKNIQYLYKKDAGLKYKRGENDGFDLMVINDFVDDNNFKKYYWDEANDLNSNGTMIYIEKFIRLEDCIKPDTSDWQTYRNEKFGFEFDYLSEWKIEEHNNGISVKQKISPNFYSSVFSVHILLNPEKLSALEWAKGYDSDVKVVKHGSFKIEQKGVIKVNDDIQIYKMIHSEEYFDEHGPDYSTNFFFNPNRSKIFRFSFGQAPHSDAINILSTFKFIEK